MPVMFSQQPIVLMGEFSFIHTIDFLKMFSLTHINKSLSWFCRYSKFDVANLVVYLGAHNIKTNEVERTSHKVIRLIKHKGFDQGTLVRWNLKFDVFSSFTFENLFFCSTMMWQFWHFQTVPMFNLNIFNLFVCQLVTITLKETRYLLFNLVIGFGASNFSQAKFFRMRYSHQNLHKFWKFFLFSKIFRVKIGWQRFANTLFFIFFLRENAYGESYIWEKLVVH